MNQHHIAVIDGSLRKVSFNRKLTTALSKLAPPDVAFMQMQIDHLPHYNQSDDGKQADSVVRLKAGISAAHGVLLVTAEYNCSIPGVLKDAIDHASRPNSCQRICPIDAQYHGGIAVQQALAVGVDPPYSRHAGQARIRNASIKKSMSTLTFSETFLRVG